MFLQRFTELKTKLQYALVNHPDKILDEVERTQKNDEKYKEVCWTDSAQYCWSPDTLTILYAVGSIRDFDPNVMANSIPKDEKNTFLISQEFIDKLIDRKKGGFGLM